CHELFACSWSLPPFGYISKDCQFVSSGSQSFDQEVAARIDRRHRSSPILVSRSYQLNHQTAAGWQRAIFNLYYSADAPAAVSSHESYSRDVFKIGRAQSELQSLRHLVCRLL